MRNVNFSTVSLPRKFIDKIKEAVKNQPPEEYGKKQTVSGLIQKIVSDYLKKKGK
jgi:hypothetical protein